MEALNYHQYELTISKLKHFLHLYYKIKIPNKHITLFYFFFYQRNEDMIYQNSPNIFLRIFIKNLKQKLFKI